MRRRTVVALMLMASSVPALGQDPGQSALVRYLRSHAVQIRRAAASITPTNAAGVNLSAPCARDTYVRAAEDRVQRVGTLSGDSEDQFNSFMANAIGVIAPLPSYRADGTACSTAWLSSDFLRWVVPSSGAAVAQAGSPRAESSSEAATETSAAASSESILGEYTCVTTGGKPCATNTPLRLADGGAWGWGRYNGDYSVSGGSVHFRGVGGAATWGPAVIGANSLTFSSSFGPSIWQRAGHSDASLDGVYTCRTAPGGRCLTRTPIRIEGAEWHWGSDGGSYSVLDGGKRIKFSGLSSGPGGWGIADIGPRTLTWHTRSGDSMWSR